MDASGLRSNDTLERYTYRHNGRLPTAPIPTPKEEEKPLTANYTPTTKTENDEKATNDGL